MLIQTGEQHMADVTRCKSERGFLECMFEMTNNSIKMAFWGLLIILFHFCGLKTIDQWAKVAKRIGKVKAEWQWGEKEWKEEVQQVIIEKTKTPLSWAWQHPLHQVPPIPPSKLAIQFHPDKGISSTPPATRHPFISPFISLFPNKWK